MPHCNLANQVQTKYPFLLFFFCLFIYVWCSGKSNEKSANEFSCKMQKRTVSFLCFKLLMLISNIHNKKTSKHN